MQVWSQSGLRKPDPAHAREKRKHVSDLKPVLQRRVLKTLEAARHLAHINACYTGMLEFRRALGGASAQRSQRE